jgi:hypothetical protein
VSPDAAKLLAEYHAAKVAAREGRRAASAAQRAALVAYNAAQEAERAELGAKVALMLALGIDVDDE